MPVRNGAIQEFETPPLSGLLMVWQPLADNSRKITSPSTAATIPPRIRISEQVFVKTSPVRLRAALLPAWPASPSQARKSEHPCTLEPFAPKPRVWVRTSNPLHYGLRLSKPAGIWTRPRNSNLVQHELRPMDPVAPATTQPALTLGILRRVADLPMARRAPVPALCQADDLPYKSSLAQPDAIPCNPSEASLPPARKPASLQPGLAFTEGFRISYKNPNSYIRRSLPRPWLVVCEQVTLPRPPLPVSLGRTIKESDTPADQEIEIYQSRHAHQPA